MATHPSSHTEVHHRCVGPPDETLAGEVVVLDNPRRLPGVGLTSTEVEHPHRTFDDLPPVSHLEGRHVGRIEGDGVFSRKGSRGRLAVYLEIHHELITGRPAHETDLVHVVVFDDLDSFFSLSLLAAKIHHPMVAIHDLPRAVDLSGGDPPGTERQAVLPVTGHGYLANRGSLNAKARPGDVVAVRVFFEDGVGIGPRLEHVIPVA